MDWIGVWPGLAGWAEQALGWLWADGAGRGRGSGAWLVQGTDKAMIDGGGFFVR